MKYTVFILFCVFLLSVGCIRQTKEETIEKEIGTSDHHYELIFIDGFGKPLEGVQLDYTLESKFRTINRSTVTPSNGRLYVYFNVPEDPQSVYRSSLSFIAKKEGYDPYNGKLYINDSKKVSSKRINVVLNLSRKRYFQKEFYAFIDDDFKDIALQLIDNIIKPEFIKKAYLAPYSIHISYFNNRKYLHLKCIKEIVYNSINFDKYDIAKLIFDNVVRKLLTPLSEYFESSDFFDGYDISVTGFTKNFLDDSAVPEQIEYNFFIPVQIANQYKAWEISNQKLVDSSVILMDKDRIELRFQ